MKKQTSGFWSARGFRIAGLIGWVLLVASCAGQVPHATPQQTERAALQWPGVTLVSLEQGRMLYIQKCSGCHNLRTPAKYSSQRWPTLMEKMSKRAKLTEDQKQAILRYVVSVASSS